MAVVLESKGMTLMGNACKETVECLEDVKLFTEERKRVVIEGRGTRLGSDRRRSLVVDQQARGPSQLST